MADQELADRIFTFLDRHAKTAGDYDPQFDAPGDRFNGPDSSMLFAAATALSQGMDPPQVFSDWGSGCYEPWRDREAEVEHDRLVAAVNDLARTAQNLPKGFR